MKLLVMTRYGDLGASSRLRVLQYFPWFERAGIHPTAMPLFTSENLAQRYEAGFHGLGAVIGRYFSRVMTMVQSGRFDLIWIEKELIPFAPAWFEKMLMGGSRYIMDFDDATFHNYDQHRVGLIRTCFGRKIDKLMNNAAMVIAGNDYLAARARNAGCRWVEIVPTVIDLEQYPQRMPRDSDDTFVVGWIGSPSTTKYLEQVGPPLAVLSLEHPVRLRVIGGLPIELEGVEIESLAWSEETESEMLSECDAGIMPLFDSPWERGKCGYKLIQYMACSLPTLASPVGVNSKILTTDSGFLCQHSEQWLAAFRELSSDSQIGFRMGKIGRTAVEENYCIQVTGPRVSALLKIAAS